MQMIKLKNLAELYSPDTRLLFYVSEEAVQNEAVGLIGRRLTDKELHSVAMGLEFGFGGNLGFTLATAIDGAVMKTRGG